MATLLVLTIIGGLATVALMYYRSASDRTLTFTAQFEDAVGLYEGNAVSVLGMPIGTVTSIVPKGGYVDVTMAIDGEIAVPAHVQAVTVNTSILTDRHVELTPAYTGGPKLRNGDIVGMDRTRTPVEFDRTLAMIDKLSLSLSGDGRGQGPLADFIAASSGVVNGNGPAIKEALDELSKALRLGPDNGAETSKDIKSVVTSLADLTSAAAENDSTIRDFGSNLRQVSDILADERLGTGDTGKQVNEILSISAQLLESNRDKLKTTVTDANGLTKILVDNQREVAEAFDLAPLVADNSYNTIDSNAGVTRSKLLIDKVLFDGMFAKEVCNITNKKQLGCATGTMRDFGPDFGLSMMFDLMGQPQ